MSESINQNVVFLEVSANFLPTAEMILESFINPDELSAVERYSDLRITTSYQEVDKVSEKTYTVYGIRRSKSDLGIIEVENNRSRISIKALVSNQREACELETSVYVEMVQNKIKDLVEDAKQQLLESLFDAQTIQKKLSITSVVTTGSDLLEN